MPKKTLTILLFLLATIGCGNLDLAKLAKQAEANGGTLTLDSIAPPGWTSLAITQTGPQSNIKFCAVAEKALGFKLSPQRPKTIRLTFLDENGRVIATRQTAYKKSPDLYFAPCAGGKNVFREVHHYTRKQAIFKLSNGQADPSCATEPQKNLIRVSSLCDSAPRH